MPPRKPFPKLCYHKGTRRFFIDYQGSWRYWPTGTSKAIAQADYDSMRESYEASGTFAMPQKDRRAGRTVDTLIDAYLKHCDVYYANSKATVGNIERALTPLHERFGRRPIEAFGPRLLREVRDDMVQKKLSRKVINTRVQSIVRMFKWAVAEELATPAIFEALRTVEGLRAGRTNAHEGPGRKPVPWEHVEPVLAHVSREVAAMLVIQSASGARPGEVVQMRLADLDRTGKVWTYKPRHHKTQYLGKMRMIPLFTEAQEALEPFVKRVPPLDPEELIFSPVRAEAERSVHRRASRQTKVQPSQLAREARPPSERERPPRAAYDSNTYARAVRRGIEATNKATVWEKVRGAVEAQVPSEVQDRIRVRLARPPAGILRLLEDPESKSHQHEAARLLRTLRRVARWATTNSASTEDILPQIQTAALAAAAGAKSHIVPFWSPYQLRHRFATEGEQRFGQAAVSLAMGHASLRMTEHYIERNLRDVFERMAEHGQA